MFARLPAQRRAVLGLVVRAVVKPFVPAPRQAAELHVAQGVLQRALGIVRVNHHHLAPVGSALAQLVGRVRAVWAEFNSGQRRCSVLGKRVGIQKNVAFRGHFAGRLGLHPRQDRLTLQPRIVVKIGVIALRKRRGNLFVVPNGSQAIAQFLAVGNRLQHILRGAVLRGHPLRRLGAAVVLQPAVRIRNRLSKIRVDGVPLGGHRVLGCLGACSHAQNHSHSR